MEKICKYRPTGYAEIFETWHCTQVSVLSFGVNYYLFVWDLAFKSNEKIKVV